MAAATGMTNSAVASGHLHTIRFVLTASKTNLGSGTVTLEPGWYQLREHLLGLLRKWHYRDADGRTPAFLSGFRRVDRMRQASRARTCTVEHETRLDRY